MKLILAKSNDGFFATGPADNMKWTGPVDKFVFKLLTLFSAENYIFAGITTYKMMPPLPGRKVMALSRSEMTLEQAYDLAPKGWIIGGPTIAKLALQNNFIDKAVICTPNVNIGHGIPADEVMSYLDDSSAWVKESLTFNKEITVSIYSRINSN